MISLILKKKAVPAQPPSDRKWSAAIGHSHTAWLMRVVLLLLSLLVLIIAYSSGGSGPLLSGKETLSTGSSRILH